MTKTLNPVLTPRELQAVAIDNFWANNLHGLPNDVVEDIGFVPFDKIADIGRTTVDAAFKSDTSGDNAQNLEIEDNVINIDGSPYDPTQDDLIAAKSRHPASRRSKINESSDNSQKDWRLTTRQRRIGLSGVEKARKILEQADENDQTD